MKPNNISKSICHMMTLVLMCWATQSLAQSTHAKTHRILGACHLVGNSPIAANEMTVDNSETKIFPKDTVAAYFHLYEHRIIKGDAKVTVLRQPKHGELLKNTVVIPDDSGPLFHYLPHANYLGKDSATFLVEVGGYKVKLEYFIQAIEGSAGGNTAYQMYCGDKDYPFWKISTALMQPIYKRVGL